MVVAWSIMGLGVAVMFTLIAVLIGGITTAKMSVIFADLGINETNNADWYTLSVNTSDYATTGIGIALVGLILTGVLVLLQVVLGAFGGMGRRGGFGF